MSENNNVTQGIIPKLSDEKDFSSDELFKQGKKFYFVGDFSNAMEFIAKSCKLKEAQVGTLSDEMFDLYFYLAKSYFMFSKTETDVLGEKLDYKDENINVESATEDDCESDSHCNDLQESNEFEKDQLCTDNEEKNDVELNNEIKIDIEKKQIFHKNDQDRMCSDNEEKNEFELHKGTHIEKDQIQHNNDQDQLSTNHEGKIDVELDKITAINDISDKCNKEIYDEKDVSYLQLSYETIECAKLILNRQIRGLNSNLKDLELKLADCCNIVGNIYMEEGNLKEAINEYKKALELNQKNAVIDDRAVAESFFNLALAYMEDSEFSEAIAYFEKCKGILSSCLNTCMAAGDESSELAEIITDINEKISESKDGERDYRLAKESVKKVMAMSKSDLPVNEISHLVKRKNSITLSDSGLEPPTKMRKQDSVDK